jgi:DNA (cytosine-5)-methyltransferase 1
LIFAKLNRRASLKSPEAIKLFCFVLHNPSAAALLASVPLSRSRHIPPRYNIRLLHAADLPGFDVLIGGIPCTSHSNLGRAKKKLAQKPELGDSGDLFLPVLNLVNERMPAAVVFENVPAFGQSLAGELLAAHLQRLGYQVLVTVLRPNEEWGEIEDRKRWLLVGTLNCPFRLVVPGQRCVTPVSAWLDPPNPVFDKPDAYRIALTIEGLRAHQSRHEMLGHGFGFTTLDGAETRLPTIPASYHKINTGPFVQTPYGHRLLRQAEIERIHGCALRTKVYSTAARMLGQGVQTRIFREIFRQLGDNLIPRAE